MINKFLKYWFETLLFLLSLLILFFSFQFNIFDISSKKFKEHQKDSESLVIGRIAKSRTDGVLSEAGLLGRHETAIGGENDFQHQYELFTNETRGENYKTYNSQIGLHGIFFSLIDKVLNICGIDDNMLRLQIYRGLTSALLAIILSAIILLFYFEIGIYPVILLLFSIALSPWLVLIGRNLYWVFGLMYLPMLITFMAFKYQELTDQFNKPLIYSAIFLSIFLKSSFGYEFISTIMLAMLAPMIYFTIKNDTPYRQTFVYILQIGLVAVAGFIAAFFVHIMQLSVVLGGFSESFASVFGRVSVRTGLGVNLDAVESVYIKSLNASSWKVLLRYFMSSGSVFIIIFALVSRASLHMLKSPQYNVQEKRTIKALFITTWFSFFAPVSWFVLAKAHSYIHTHINIVLWDLPFKIFGFALTFYFIFGAKYNVKKQLK